MKPVEITAYAARYGSRFASWMFFVLEWECVQNRVGDIIAENDPDDPGGLTFAGLDRASHPSFPYRCPTPKAVADTYYSDYWLPSRAEELRFPVGEVVANFAVNMGRKPAVDLLQTAINLLPEKGSCVVDGVLGPATIAAARSEDPHQLADLIEDRADLRYRGIVVANAKMSKFLQGWLNRDNALEAWWKKIEPSAAQAA